MTPEQIAAHVCREVAELPDRNSPEGWPEAMLVTHDELNAIVRAALSAATPSTVSAEARDAARWRWLRGKEFASGGSEEDDFRWASSFDDPDALDAAIDAAMGTPPADNKENGNA